MLTTQTDHKPENYIQYVSVLSLFTFSTGRGFHSPAFATFKTRVLCWPRPEDAYSLQKDIAWVIKSAVNGNKKLFMSRVGDV